MPPPLRCNYQDVVSVSESAVASSVTRAEARLGPLGSSGNKRPCRWCWQVACHSVPLSLWDESSGRPDRVSG